MTKEFEVTIKIRNNLLKSRRLSLGMGLVEFAEHAGVSPSSYCALEGLRMAPVCGRRFGKPGLVWRESVKRLAEFHRCLPEDLFPDSVLAVTCPEVVKEIGASELCPLLGSQQAECVMALPAPDPETALESEEMGRLLAGALDELSYREREVVRKRFDEGLTYDEIGKEQGVVRERIRQIESKALRKLREKGRLERYSVLREAAWE